MPRSQGFQRYFPTSRVQFAGQLNATDGGFHEHYSSQLGSAQHFMSQSLPQPLDEQASIQQLYTRPGQNTAFVPIRASNQMYPMAPTSMANDEGLYSLQLGQAMFGEGYDYDPQYSESSSRSHTPPLPPLSPDITPPDSPPETPPMLRKNRSSSIWVTNQHSPQTARRNRADSLKPRKNVMGRSQSANYKLGDNRSPPGRPSGGKGRRKSKHGSRNSSRASSVAGKDSRRSSGNRGRIAMTSSLLGSLSILLTSCGHTLYFCHVWFKPYELHFALLFRHVSYFLHLPLWEEANCCRFHKFCSVSKYPRLHLFLSSFFLTIFFFSFLFLGGTLNSQILY